MAAAGVPRDIKDSLCNWGVPRITQGAYNCPYQGMEKRDDLSRAASTRARQETMSIYEGEGWQKNGKGGPDRAVTMWHSGCSQCELGYQHFYFYPYEPSLVGQCKSRSIGQHSITYRR